MENKILNKLETIERYSLLAAKNVLCLDEAALFTGLSKSHLYKLTCTNKIPYYKPMGKMCYFNRIELEQWLQQNRCATDAELNMKAQTYCMKGGKL